MNTGERVESRDVQSGLSVSQGETGLRGPPVCWEMWDSVSEIMTVGCTATRACELLEPSAPGEERETGRGRMREKEKSGRKSEEGREREWERERERERERETYIYLYVLIFAIFRCFWFPSALAIFTLLYFMPIKHFEFEFEFEREKRS